MEKVGKIVTIILWALLIVSAVLVVSLMVNISENEADPTMGGWINTNLLWAYMLIAIGAGVAILPDCSIWLPILKLPKKD
jgi:hypothetical protein